VHGLARAIGGVLTGWAAVSSFLVAADGPQRRFLRYGILPLHVQRSGPQPLGNTLTLWQGAAGD